MAEMLPPQRSLKVFLASPGDVVQERAALARLVRDINDVLAFLAPTINLRIELVGYETHSYPDIGSPQDVINKQIPLDYDIFVGVMWKRCGTPTAHHPSGTIEEFRRAAAKRKESGLPRIMFYFCEEPIAIPDVEGARQLIEVVNFRAELAKLGLISSYPTHGEFSEHVRGGLLRAIRDILREEMASVPGIEAAAPSSAALDGARKAMLALAEEYLKIRKEMPSSGERTRQMTMVFAKMKASAASVRELLPEFAESESSGARLAAIAILQMFPNPDLLDWLATRLDSPALEKPFIGYQAAVALAEAVRALPPENCPEMRVAVAKARSLAGLLPQDSGRLNILEIIEAELDQRCPSQARSDADSLRR